jgi:hypothetical protein
MKKTFTHLRPVAFLKRALFMSILVVISAGCQTKTQDETDEKNDSMANSGLAQPDLNSDQSELLGIILGNTEEGIIRGVSFGDGVAKVKATETFDMFEETPDHLGFTTETTQLESIDVQYFLTSDKKVNKIQLDVYLNSAEATRQLWNAGKVYFNKTYNAPKEEADKLIIWNHNNVKVQMEDVTTGKDFGLKFEFIPSNKTALAAK